MSNSDGMNELLAHYHENKLSHAFLLETNDQEQCLKNLLEFLAFINRTGDEEEDEKLSHMILHENFPSLIVIRPEGVSIRKEQILDLKNIFKTKPIFSKYNMYILMNAECLNLSSANTMLKFLEEPEDNILAFFITNNKENIIETIKSRCQVVMDCYSNVVEVSIPKVWQSIAVNYVKEYECVHDEAILYNKNVLLPLIHDKKECLYLFKSIFQIYEMLYKCKLNSSSLIEEYQDLAFLLKHDVSFFVCQLSYISNILDHLNYNVNINLLLDRFVLEGR